MSFIDGHAPIWATISHDTLYATAATSRHVKEDLREMGHALQHCEELAERIVADRR